MVFSTFRNLNASLAIELIGKYTFSKYLGFNFNLKSEKQLGKRSC